MCYLIFILAGTVLLVEIFFKNNEIKTFNFLDFAQSQCISVQPSHQ
jgi:hypothetical protein